MNKKVDSIQNSNAVLVTEENDDIDVLDRKEFIERIKQIIEYYADKKQSVSFSIQGTWGCGKSWILNKVYNDLYNFENFDKCGSKYCIFTYNAWDYDYYDEPLISLFISVYKQLNNENAVLIKNEKARKKVKALFDTLKDSFLEELKPIPFIGNIINFKQKYDKKRESCDEKIRKYDYHFDLNQIMEATIKGLNKISKEKTLVIFVDELDRCLPQYAIKVLERIHHISKNVQNLQIIYSIDKEQLEETVRNIFGQKVNASDYLKKFISFGFNLDNGEVNENFLIKYKNLFDSFDFIFTDNFDKEKAFISILSEMNMRNREILIQKIELINSILNKNNEKLDISILYVELFLAYCSQKEIDICNSIVHYTNDILSFEFLNEKGLPVKSVFVSQYFNKLTQCHNVKHKLHGYDGFYKANIEYVIYNLINNLMNRKLSEYSIAWEQDFYRKSFAILNNFINLYNSIEI